MSAHLFFLSKINFWQLFLFLVKSLVMVFLNVTGITGVSPSPIQIGNFSDTLLHFLLYRPKFRGFFRVDCSWSLIKTCRTSGVDEKIYKNRVSNLNGRVFIFFHLEVLATLCMQISTYFQHVSLRWRLCCFAYHAII